MCTVFMPYNHYCLIVGMSSQPTEHDMFKESDRYNRRNAIFEAVPEAVCE